jgi:hypothetical protein
MSQNHETHTPVGSPETHAFTGADFLGKLDERAKVLELNPYVDRDALQNGPAQQAYDKIVAQIVEGTVLTEEQETVFRYLASEVSFMNTQLTVDKGLIDNKDKHEEAILRASDALVERLESDATLTPESKEEHAQFISYLDKVIERIEDGAELSDGAELLDYLQAGEFADTWNKELGVHIGVENPGWIIDGQEQKRLLVEERIDQLQAEAQIYLLLAQQYPSDLVKLNQEHNT